MTSRPEWCVTANFERGAKSGSSSPVGVCKRHRRHRILRHDPRGARGGYSLVKQWSYLTLVSTVHMLMSCLPAHPSCVAATWTTSG
jgi:hypothetical protein